MKGLSLELTNAHRIPSFRQSVFVTCLWRDFMKVKPGQVVDATSSCAALTVEPGSSVALHNNDCTSSIYLNQFIPLALEMDI